MCDVEIDNFQQVFEILRYRDHLARLGAELKLDEAATQWVRRYAALWRRRRSRRGQR